MRYLYFNSGYFSYIIRLLFPFRYPIKLDTEYFGRYLYEHMYVVRTYFCLYDFHFLPITQCSQYFSYLSTLLSIEYFAADTFGANTI